MRVRLLSLLLPLLAAAPLAAQEDGVDVPGRVLDAASGEPIADAVVRLPRDGRLAVSDSAGRFVLRRVPQGTHAWEISRIGFATWTEEVEAGPDDEFTIRLLPQPQVLEGLVVVADQFRQRRAAAGMSARVLDRGEVVRAAGGDLHAFLQVRLGVPLMTCKPDDPDQNCAWLRGDKVAITVFVDEQRASGGLTQLRGLPPSDVHSIELFAGGTMVRVYTEDFMRRLAKGQADLLPLPYSPGVPLPGALSPSQ
ncbi:MAG TPA: carboxypeptidase regulatory-like domain-containing protein [Longimicrobiaceae bacterium]|nr:carboxypeptidase regulatory-like domain-containing protein [Longimicrobiaceae bacterium]